MKIYFSNQGNLRNFQTFVKKIDLSDPSRLEISTHDKWITVHPANLALAAALAIKVGRENAEIVGQVPETGRYLDRMGLYDLVKTPSPFSYQEREPAGRFVPISVIKTPEQQSHFITDIVPLLHLPEHNARIIRYVISELVRNVLEHSFSRDGAIVVAQYYKKTNKISLAICDTGIGIWQSMNTFWHPRTDLEAILLALTPGITGTTRREGGTESNAGAGLFFTKSIAKNARSYFVIYSGTAAYTLLKHRKRLVGPPRLYSNPEDDAHAQTNSAALFSGTLVAVDIALDLIGEFQDVMDDISDAYDSAIRDRKRSKYREPNFL